MRVSSFLGAMKIMLLKARAIIFRAGLAICALIIAINAGIIGNGRDFLAAAIALPIYLALWTGIHWIFTGSIHGALSGVIPSSRKES